MNSDLENKIAAQFGGKLKRIDVPELDVTWYASPFTLAELGKIDRLAKGDRIETLVYTLIEKVVDETGERVFTVADKPTIQNKLPSDLVADIVAKINEPDGFEVATGN